MRSISASRWMGAWCRRNRSVAQKTRTRSAEQTRDSGHAIWGVLRWPPLTHPTHPFLPAAGSCGHPGLALRRTRRPAAPPRATHDAARPPSPAPKPAGLGAAARAQMAAQLAADSGGNTNNNNNNALPLPRSGKAVTRRVSETGPRRGPTLEPGTRAAHTAAAAAAHRKRAGGTAVRVKAVQAPPPAPAAEPPLARVAALARGAAAALAARWPVARLAANLVCWMWLLLPFRVRSLAWRAVGPPAPPSLHASPRAAALRAAAARGDGEAALSSLGFGADGRFPGARPLADTPKWRLEALVGRGLSARGADRVRAALTAPSSVSLTIPSATRAEFERLEYLGDAVLELAARRCALRAFPRATEHVLCNAARALVCGRTLLAAASAARLDAYAVANGHAMADPTYSSAWSGPGGAALLVDAFEAVAGALFLEAGLEAAAAWVVATLTPVLGGAADMVAAAVAAHPTDRAASLPATPAAAALLGLDHNYKSLLVLAAGADGVTYRGRHVRAAAWGGTSPGHPVAPGPASLAAVGGGGRPRDAWVWECACLVDGAVRGMGVNMHRSTAEQAAAREALAGLGVDAEALWLERVSDQL